MRNSGQDSPPLATQALLAAALSGLLVVGAACSGETGPSQPTSSQTAGGGEGVTWGGGATSGGGGANAPGITWSTEDPDMTQEKFEQICAEREGKLEIHPHCGGANSCKGLSYDSTTQVLTEHTCKGLNTCTGYSCVVS